MKHCMITLLVILCLSMTALAADRTELHAVGRAVGIQLQEDGVTVTGFTEDSGAAAAGIQEGDRIVRINGQTVEATEDITAIVSSGEPLTVTVERNGKEADYLLTPQQVEGGYLLGLRIRDSIAGIGTVTYYDDQSGEYGALGHGVSAADSDQLISLREGELISTSISGVEKGKRGTAGQLQGNFDGAQLLGTVEKNTDSGIFGHMAAAQDMGERCEIAEKGAVTAGDAVILANVDGTEPQAYKAEILKIYPDGQERNLLLEVTDPVLLEKTGGIVQGMSGSPILQDGRLVGAVTHVLVSDPTKGYGIFIENMLNAA
ncbi:MAG: SpoIVB peptidase S55 domain-containing protein [Oscillospiraceae bacterium]|nr:SpoIVB peptidase S55 domain-containing protein [Oscillospiraceae bacterium]